MYCDVFGDEFDQEASVRELEYSRKICWSNSYFR
ncbi:hypothetical protein EV209_2854 [Cuneatibacter caecimuris]|uniref:Uncharacterized protein n=1 Tax=Cuneatibacter caecimuris TaxID=1796618 RepID=A0A4Q7NZ97_9FIRM|nr:hypothetical protein EV209_2854 [Cuneatibacter caecimuris]